MKNKKILLAFSAGIDSCHAARVLASQGAKVTAMTLNTCGDNDMVERARGKAAQLGIDFMEVDVRWEFKSKIIDYFVSEYLLGRTPAPCTLCNRVIKWEMLYQKAQEGGFDKIATGHYFNIEKRGELYYVRRAIDPIKDQSYYLWMLPQQALAMAITPMGAVIKKDMVHSLKVTESDLPQESMGVCFLNGRSCSDFLGERCPEIQTGEIIDKNGRVIGEHLGTPYYTIGQKKGLTLKAGLGSQSCVIGIDSSKNRVVAGMDSDLYHHNLIVSGCQFVDASEAMSASDVSVKIRGLGRNPEGYCTVNQIDGSSYIRVLLNHPAWAAATGQPVVFYRGELVIGGGFLESSY